MDTKYQTGDDPLPSDLNDYWARFFESEHTRQPGRNSYQDIFDNPLLFPLQRVRETEWMIQKAREVNPKTIYEIGTDKGGGLYHWCKCFPTVKKVIACEIRGTPYADLFENAFPNIQFLWISDSSYDPRIVRKVKNWVNSLDVLFIDGDKCHFDADFDCYYGSMSPNSQIFMHDVQDSAPVEAFERTKIAYPSLPVTKYVNTDESKESIERECRGIDPASTHEQWLRYWRGRSCGVGLFELGESQ